MNKTVTKKQIKDCDKVVKESLSKEISKKFLELPEEKRKKLYQIIASV